MNYYRSPVSKRIKFNREKLGLSCHEVATKMGLNIEAYDDLESYDDEIFRCISLKQVKTLSITLHIPTVELIAKDVTDL